MIKILINCLIIIKNVQINNYIKDQINKFLVIKIEKLYI